jgi:hypothetical protein
LVVVLSRALPEEVFTVVTSGRSPMHQEALAEPG